MKGNEIGEVRSGEIEEKVKCVKEEVLNVGFELGRGEVEKSAGIREVGK